MKIALFSPYGTFSQETGLLYLLARFLHAQCLASVESIVCNGVFSACDRDEEVHWKRKFQSCAQCTYEQHEYIEWAKVNRVELSSLITPSAVLALETLQFEELTALPPELEASFKRKFSVPTFDPKHKAQAHYAEKLQMGSERFKAGLRKYLATPDKPNLFFIANGENFLARSALEELTRAEIPVSLFSFSMEARGIRVFHHERKEFLSCALMIPDVRALRSDIDSWSGEVLEILNEITAFLGIN